MPRRCSICREEGHFKNRCPNAERLRLAKAAEQNKKLLQLHANIKIKTSPLSFYPALVVAKLKIHRHIWGDTRVHRMFSSQSPETNKFFEIHAKIRLIRDYVKTIKDHVFDNKQPASKFRYLFPLDFWTRLFREVTSVIPAAIKRIAGPVDKPDYVDSTLPSTQKHLMRETHHMYKYNIAPLLSDMEWPIRRVLNAQTNRSGLLKPMLMEHIREVMSYL